MIAQMLRVLVHRPRWAAPYSRCYRTWSCGSATRSRIVLSSRTNVSQGGKLVPALEAVVSDWSETLRLQREAKALRSGVEASVALLALLPFVFLITVQLLAPTLLAPFRSPAGEVVFGLAIAWMALGYGILQRMSRPPRESRLRLREAVT